MIKIIFNGEAREVAEHTKISDVLDEYGLGKHSLIIEVNGEIIPSDSDLSMEIKEHDEINAFCLVGGG